MTKFVLVTGGVISGIGKGVIASSTGTLLRMAGLRVTSIKIDPYLNIDAGTLSPLDHGEVFVLDDGGEVDLDLGNYERFVDVTLSREHNITTGKVYRSVIERERRGDFAGKTVQVVPHITDAIQEWVANVATLPVDDSQQPPDVCIVELGGTVGDIESAPFIEAMRQFQFRVGPHNMAVIHVSLVPTVGPVGEQKTKPTQASVATLRGAGLNPDIVACRSSSPLSETAKHKISMFCHVTPSQVFAVHDCSSVYHVPLLLGSDGLLSVLDKSLHLKAALQARIAAEPSILNEAAAWTEKWMSLAKMIDSPRELVHIAVVGKYTSLSDSYISVIKSLEHASLSLQRKVSIIWIEATDLELASKEEIEAAIASGPISPAASPATSTNSLPSTTLLESHEHDAADGTLAWNQLRCAQGIVVPGGFGDRGVEGKILAARYARCNNVPYLGLCLGMQVAVIEYARNVCNIKGAHSGEFRALAGGSSEDDVVVNMPEIPLDNLGGTMRLGARTTVINDNKYRVANNDVGCLSTILHNGMTSISERHRHRYEVNPAYIDTIENAGMFFVGRDETGTRMEIMELPSSVHPFYVASQYHPEYKTRPLRPAPLFRGVVMAACGLNIRDPETTCSMYAHTKTQASSSNVSCVDAISEVENSEFGSKVISAIAEGGFSFN